MKIRFSTLVIVAAAGLAACSEPEPPVRTVTLNGTVVAPDHAPDDGYVRVNLYHAWALEGALRHPLAEIESFDASPGAFSHEFDYPLEKGEGLAVHAWLDVDGDGVYCTPTVRKDIGGLTVLETLPTEGPVEVTVTLEQPCAAAGWFYPPGDGR